MAEEMEPPEADASNWVAMMVEKGKEADRYYCYSFLQLRCASGRRLSDEHRAIVETMIQDDDELRALYADSSHPLLVSTVGTRQLKALWTNLINYKPVAQLPSNERFAIFEYYGLFLAIGLSNFDESFAHVQEYMASIPDVDDDHRLRFDTAMLGCAMHQAQRDDNPALCHRLSKQAVSQVIFLRGTPYPAHAVLCEAWRFAAWSFEASGDLINALKCCKKVLANTHVNTTVASTFSALEFAIGALKRYLSKPLLERIIDKHVTRLLNEGMDEDWQEGILIASYILVRGCCPMRQCPNQIGLGMCEHPPEPYSLAFELRLATLGSCPDEVQPDLLTIGRDAIWQYHGNQLRRLTAARNAIDFGQPAALHVFECMLWLCHLTCWDWMMGRDRSRESTLIRDYLAQLHSRDRSVKTQNGHHIDIVPIRNVLNRTLKLLITGSVSDQTILDRFQKLDKNKAMTCTDYELIPLVLWEFAATAVEGRAVAEDTIEKAKLEEAANQPT